MYNHKPSRADSWHFFFVQCCALLGNYCVAITAVVDFRFLTVAHLAKQQLSVKVS